MPLEKTLALFIIYSKCNKEDEKIFNEKQKTEMLKIFGLIETI